jgi:hypothetical protein
MKAAESNRARAQDFRSTCGDEAWRPHRFYFKPSELKGILKPVLSESARAGARLATERGR